MSETSGFEPDTKSPEMFPVFWNSEGSFIDCFSNSGKKYVSSELTVKIDDKKKMEYNKFYFQARLFFACHLCCCLAKEKHN